MSGPRPAIRWSKRARESVISSSTGPSNCTTSCRRGASRARPGAASAPAAVAASGTCPRAGHAQVRVDREVALEAQEEVLAVRVDRATAGRRAARASGRAEARVRRERSRPARGPRGSGGSGWRRSGSCRPRAVIGVVAEPLQEGAPGVPEGIAGTRQRVASALLPQAVWRQKRSRQRRGNTLIGRARRGAPPLAARGPGALAAAWAREPRKCESPMSGTARARRAGDDRGPHARPVRASGGGTRRARPRRGAGGAEVAASAWPDVRGAGAQLYCGRARPV